MSLSEVSLTEEVVDDERVERLGGRQVKGREREGGGDEQRAAEDPQPLPLRRISFRLRAARVMAVRDESAPEDAQGAPHDGHQSQPGAGRRCVRVIRQEEQTRVVGVREAS